MIFKNLILKYSSDQVTSRLFNIYPDLDKSKVWDSIKNVVELIQNKDIKEYEWIISAKKIDIIKETEKLIDDIGDTNKKYSDLIQKELDEFYKIQKVNPNDYELFPIDIMGFPIQEEQIDTSIAYDIGGLTTLELASAKVDRESFNDINELDFLAMVIYESTYYGFTDEQRQETFDSWEKNSKNYEDFTSFEDLKKELEETESI